MDTATVIVTIVSVIAGKSCVLMALWLRLRWRTRHEQVQRQHLAAVAEAIAEAGQVEVIEQRADGHRIRIKITHRPGD
ncbi:hypothetical protein [Streptomyces sp. NPDC002889]|uniref:hypothetical protein n=1 Tax=Streptomyces sp. NPDC002889 TaxID=3364669 RepID=UPI0036D06F50